jgi:AraC-like DNA-binding protein
VSTILKRPTKGDPSDILQLFPKYNLQLLCCRYWWLKHWEFRELSFPYWRIYRNSQKGAFITYNGNVYELDPGKIFMIAPNTSYSTNLFDHEIPKSGYSLEGGRIDNTRSEEGLIKEGSILHLFIHFSIGVPYDSISPGVFSFDVTDDIEKKLSIITNHLNVDFTRFSFHSFLALQSLIGDLLLAIPSGKWDSKTNDFRIIEVLNYIDENINSNLSNQILASNARLSTNAFTRLFTTETGESPQRFVKRKRIDKACVLLHHSDYSIDKVALETGFSNRYHFTRIFKLVTGISPAKYRKEFGVK